MEWLSDNWWAAWFTAAVALTALELVSLDLVLIMLAGGAAVGGIAALAGGPVALQVGLALVTAVALLAVVRPSVAKALHRGVDLKTGADALIGQRATVLREMTYTQPGRVKIGGEEWTARPYDEDDHIEPGTVVDVVQIKGATAYVLRTHQLEG